MIDIRDLGLTDKNGSCSCCADTSEGPAHADTPTEGITGSYLVEGMTCSHCAQSVTEELGAIAGVRAVSVDLEPGGTSRVVITSAAPVDAALVADAVAEAGYRLVGQG